MDTPLGERSKVLNTKDDENLQGNIGNLFLKLMCHKRSFVLSIGDIELPSDYVPIRQR